MGLKAGSEGMELEGMEREIRLDLEIPPDFSIMYDITGKCMTLG